MSLSDGRYVSFVIRVWSRRGEMVHGEAIQASTGKHVHFRDLPRLMTFILTSLKEADERVGANVSANGTSTIDPDDVHGDWLD